MRSRNTAEDGVAEVTRRRLEAMVAEAARTRSLDAPAPAPAPAPATPTPAPPSAATASPTEARDAGDPGLAISQHERSPLPAPRRAVGWLEDRLPAGLRGAGLGSGQTGFVAVVLVVGLLLAGWFVLRTTGRAGSGEVAPPSVAGTTGAFLTPSATSAGSEPPASPPPQGLGMGASTAAAGGTAGTAATGGAEVVVVDVVGKVRRPGIAVLPAGSRVVDAVKAVGGARSGVNLSSLNLARVLVDGEQLVVGSAPVPGVAAGALGPGAPASSAAGEEAEPLVNINTADETALETLPGVGPVTAAAILEWRTENGAFTSVDELLEVSGIGDATLAEIAPHVTL